MDRTTKNIPGVLQLRHRSPRLSRLSRRADGSRIESWGGKADDNGSGSLREPNNWRQKRTTGSAPAASTTKLGAASTSRPALAPRPEQSTKTEFRRVSAQPLRLSVCHVGISQLKKVWLIWRHPVLPGTAPKCARPSVSAHAILSTCPFIGSTVMVSRGWSVRSTAGWRGSGMRG